MFRRVRVSAPSKVILHGEHAVVYGKKAVAASLDLRTRMHIMPVDNRQEVIRVEFPDIGVDRSWRRDDVQKFVLGSRPKAAEVDSNVDPDFVAKIKAFLEDSDFDDDGLKMASLTCFFYLYTLVCGSSFLPMRIKVESEIPIGAGLGSSAALSVCLAAGLTAIVSDAEDLDFTCKLALVSEKILHGQPSGIDNSVSTYGGLVSFQNGSVTRIEPPNDFDFRIILVDTQVSRNTKTLVEGVRERYKANPSVLGPVLDAIDAIAKTFLETVDDMKAAGDTRDKYERLLELVEYNQKLLEAIGVSHASLEEVARLVRPFGLRAKLTGAGGGGFAFVLVPPFVKEAQVDKAKEKLAKRGFKCCETRLGVNGVRVQFDNADDSPAASNF